MDYPNCWMLLVLDAPVCWMLLIRSFFLPLGCRAFFRLTQETLGEDLHWDPNRNEAYSNDGA